MASRPGHDHVTSSGDPPRSTPVEYLTDDDWEHRLRTYLINKLDTASPGSVTAIDPTSCHTAYMCTHCTQLFETEPSLNNHIAISHSIPLSTTQNICPDVKLSPSVKEEFACHLCDRVFQYEANLQVHVKVCHCNAGNVSHVRYQCKICRKIFQHAHNFQRHVRNHYAVSQVENSDLNIQSQGKLICKHCKKQFNYPQNLLEHVIKTHKFNQNNKKVAQVKNTTVKVTPVKMTTVKVSSVCQKRTQSHNNSRAPVTHTLRCGYCSKVFTYAPHLLEHVLLTHKLSWDVAKTCPVCARVCQTRAVLRTHIIKHIDKKTCPICYKTFAIPCRLNSHIHTKHNEKINFCLKVFRNCQFLQKRVIKTHRGKRRSSHCKLCDKDFCRYFAYKKHWLAMHPDMPTYTCDFCNKGNFIDKASLREHMIEMHVKNYYSCQVCNSSFSKAFMFKKHKNVAHFNIKCKIVGNKIVSCDDKFNSIPSENCLRMFKCSKCPYDSMKKIYLKKHLMKKHNMLYEFSDGTCVEQKKLVVARSKSARPFVCPVCNVTYKAISALHVHCKLKHPGMTTFACHLCNKNDFVHKKHLRRHLIREHLSKIYMCTLCNTNHVDKTRLVKHLKSQQHRLDHCKIHKRKIIKCGPDDEQNTQTNITQDDMGLSSGNDKVDFNYASVEDSVNEVIENPGLLEDGETCGDFDLISHLENGDDTAGNCDVKPSDFDVSPDMYKCSICNVYFNRRSKLKWHVNFVHGAQDSDVAHKPIRISCNFCEKVFSSERTLQIHVKCHSAHDSDVAHKPMRISCKYCDKMFSSKRTLQMHVKCHSAHDDSDVAHKPIRISCNYCDKMFSSERTLQMHVKCHSAQDSDVAHKPMRISCDYCDKMFSSKRTLQMHVKCHDTNDFACYVCGARCGDAKALAQHVGIHNHVYKCRFCSYHATRLSTLRTHHGNVHHAETGHLRCHFCGSKEFLDKGDLENHIGAKHTKSTYHCTICDSRFSRKDKLVTHKTRVHFNIKCHIVNNELVISSGDKIEYKTKNCSQMGRYRCSECPYNAFTVKVFKKHLTKKHNYQFKFTCKVCNLVMGSRNALQAHEKTKHKDLFPLSSDDKVDLVSDICESDGKLYKKLDKSNKSWSTPIDGPVSCKFCSKVFQTKFGLFLHIKNHLKSQDLVQDAETRVRNRKFECKICYAACGDLRAHLRRHRTPFRCGVCHVRFKDVRGLARHNDALHVGMPRLMCEFCGGQQCTDKANLRAHISHAHLTKFSCQICGATFTNHGRLETHRTHVHFNFDSKIINNELIDCGNTDTDKAKIFKNMNCQFRCHICPFACSGLISLKRHLFKKHGEGVECLCKICEVPQQNLEMHLSIHQEVSKLNREIEGGNSLNAKNLPCHYCEFKASDRGSLNHHIRSHNMLQPFDCIYCKSSFKTKEGLRLHYIAMHHEASRHNKFHCDFCDRRNFIDKNDIENHVIFKHTASAYRCKVCRIAFLKKREYRKHSKIPHFAVQNKPKQHDVKTKPSNVKLFTVQSNRKLFTCSLCDSKFQNGNQLHVHRKTCSKNFEDTLLQCKICFKLFTTAKSFKNHFPTDHDFKYKLKCNFCMKEMTSRQDFEFHVANKHLREIYEQTSSFDVTFGQYATVDDADMGSDVMKNHVTFVSHADNRSLFKMNVFTCSICAKVCNTLNALLCHKQVHLPSRRFKCFACCNQTFKRYKCLKKHLLKQHEFFKSKSCKYCKEKFYFKSSLKDHVSLQHYDEIQYPSTVNSEVIIENESFYCLLCNVACGNEENYTLHCSSHDVNSENQLFTCHECKKTFTSKSEITRHIRTVHCKSVPMHECTICNESCPSMHLLRRHVSSVHCKNTNTCPFCERIYHNVTEHVNKMHLDTTEYQCKFCTQKLVGFTNLRYHENIEHTEEKYKITCHICNLNVATRNLLKVHLKVEHKYFKQYLCHFCGDDFDAAYRLNAHVRSKHSENKPENKPEIKPTIKCPKCNAMFKNTQGLNKHLTKVHMKQTFRCNLCKKKYKSLRMLCKHKFLIHKVGQFVEGNFKVGDFECPRCFRRYRTEKMQLFHYNREHVACTCDICHRQLQGKHSMEKHLEYSHAMKEKVYPCQICGYVAVTRGRLRKHKLVNHNKNRLVGKRARKKRVN